MYTFLTAATVLIKWFLWKFQLNQGIVSILQQEYDQSKEVMLFLKV